MNFETVAEKSLLWVGMLAGPLLWLIQLEVNYALVPWVCSEKASYILHISSLIFLLLALTVAMISWQNWRKAVHTGPEDTPGGIQGTGRLMAGVGFMSSILFFLIILAQSIPSFILDPCQF